MASIHTAPSLKSVWMLVFCLLSFVFLAPAFADEEDEEGKAADKLPRFATLASPEVNIRTGPGTRYPIDWVIRRKGMPVEIVQQFEHWREIRTSDDTKGWVHKVMLNGYRSMMVTGTEPQVMFVQPDLDARVQARIEPNVIGKISICQRDWCQVKIQGYEGWLPKTAFWGVYPTEKIND